SVVFLTSPNNPTGTALPLETVEAVAAAAPGVVVVDEAYAEFRREGTPRAPSPLPTHPNVIVSRTLSKAVALAGARLGYPAAPRRPPPPPSPSRAPCPRRSPGPGPASATSPRTRPSSTPCNWYGCPTTCRP